MADAHGERCIITVQMDGLEDFPWVSEEKRTIFEGWRRLGHVAEIDTEQKEEQKEEQKDWTVLTKWTIGSTVTWTQIQGIETETKSHTRYTEASLVRELEKHGIGRPSTFASLLSVIQDKKYVAVQDIPPRPIQLAVYELIPDVWPYRHQTIQQTRGGEKRKLVPTPLGKSVWEWLVVHFNDLFAYEFTAIMEQSLDQIATGLIKEKEILEQTWGSYQERYHTLISTPVSKASSASSSSSCSSSSSSSSTIPIQPIQPIQSIQQIQPIQSQKQRTFKDIKAVQTKKGPLLLREGKTKDETQFFGWPKDISWGKITEEAVLKHVQEQEQEKQEKQGRHHMDWKDKTVMYRTGRYGPYLQCDGISIPFIEGETNEETVARLEKKSQPASASLKETTHYLIRSGPYGPYITKKGASSSSSSTKKAFISVPKGLTVDSLTDKEIDAIFKAGMEQKQKQKKNLMAE